MLSINSPCKIAEPDQEGNRRLISHRESTKCRLGVPARQFQPVPLTPAQIPHCPREKKKKKPIWSERQSYSDVLHRIVSLLLQYNCASPPKTDGKINKTYK